MEFMSLLKMCSPKQSHNALWQPSWPGLPRNVKVANLPFLIGCSKFPLAARPIRSTVQTWGPFLESPDNLRARKAVVVYMQDRGFNSFASNMIKLSVNETKWSSLLARTCALILYISIWKFDFGPEKLPGLSRNGPLCSDASSVWNFCARFSDAISRKNQWWRREMSAVSSGYQYVKMPWSRVHLTSSTRRRSIYQKWHVHCRST